MGPSLLRGNACPVQTVKMVGRVAGECEAGWIGARWVSQEGQAGCEELGCYSERYGEPVMGFKQGRVLNACGFIYNVRGQVNMTFSQTSCNSRGITKNKQLRYNNNFSHSFSMLL